MKDRKPKLLAGVGAPITEADLHAFVDGQLAAPRHREVEAFLASHPEALQRVSAWTRQNDALRGFFRPVLEEPLPLRLPLRRDLRPWPWKSLAAGIALCVASAGSAWFVRGALDDRADPIALKREPASTAALPEGFVRRALVAHAVYTPDVRRPVELGADQEQALAGWLTKRLGAAVHAPTLASVGYQLVGGRLLPGGKGPVAQFMYASATGQRLTLYVTREAAGENAAFRFTQEGPIKAFYWIDEHFGYALSGAIDRDELLRVSQEIYKQLS